MTSNGKHLDADALRELKQVMGDDFSLLIDTFLNDSQVRLKAIDDAISAGDSDALRRGAHSFKGSASNMAAPLLAELCKELEELGREGEVSGAPDLFEQVKREYHVVLEALQQLP